MPSRKTLAFFHSHGAKVQVLKSDNGTDYKSKAMADLLEEKGMYTT
jgi:hypothetical protein